MRSTNQLKIAVLVASLAGALLTLPQAQASGPGARISGAAAQPQQDNSTAGAAAARLDKKQFKNVAVTVDNGIATLTGTVDLYEYKSDAGKRVMHVKGIVAVRNLIEVAGPGVPDSALEAKLSSRLSYDPDAYGRVFDAITLNVADGVVTLGGHAHDYVDRDSALALVATTPGVKDVIDNIEVDPTSEMDNRIRMEVAQAVYGFPTLNRYAIDPAKPIRIAVQNGNVELYGLVDSQADKNVAFLRANGVPGVFSVKNYIEVANQPSGGK
ncbi:MAG: BON domain-containing protein [Terracidiphilus sp.]